MSSGKDHALAIGSRLASIESETGRIAGMVMQAAIHEQPGVLDAAINCVEVLRSEVNKLESEIHVMQAVMRQ